MDDTPTIPVLQHLARSGGTLIAKCLASMPHVRLLSEIHPVGHALGRPQFNPLRQARNWFGLVDHDEVRELDAMDARFPEAIADLARRAHDRGGTLVLREWSHLDYHGAPWIAEPPMRSLLLETLRDAGIATASACTTRHPADQWLSLRKLAVIADKLSLADYLRGARAFAEQARDGHVLRYEDFCREPASSLRGLCEALGLAYDASWMDRWRRYTTITGDTTGSRGGAGASAQIRALPRREIEPELREALLASDDYRAACAAQGYEP